MPDIIVLYILVILIYVVVLATFMTVEINVLHFTPLWSSWPLGAMFSLLVSSALGVLILISGARMNLWELKINDNNFIPKSKVE